MIKKQPNESGNGDNKNRAVKQGEIERRITALLTEAKDFGYKGWVMSQSLRDGTLDATEREIESCLLAMERKGLIKRHGLEGIDGDWRLRDEVNIRAEKERSEAVETTFNKLNEAVDSLVYLKLTAVGFYHVMNDKLDDLREKGTDKNRTYPSEEAKLDCISMLAFDVAKNLDAAIWRVEGAAIDLRMAMKGGAK